MSLFIERQFSAPGLTYSYVEAGNGPAVLLLHGFMGNKSDWAPLIDELAGDYRVLAVDLPGHGESAAPDDPAQYAMPAVTTDIVALLDQLDATGVHLLGYSMGGRLALYLALTQPERWRSLVLESASPGLATERERAERRKADAALADFIEREGMEAFVARWEALPLFASRRRLPQELREAHRQSRLKNRVEGLAGSLRGMGAGTQPPLWERLGALRVPALLIAGELDEKFVAVGRQMLGRMPQALLTVAPQAGHTVHLERPELFAMVVQRWLAQVDS